MLFSLISVGNTADYDGRIIATRELDLGTNYNNIQYNNTYALYGHRIKKLYRSDGRFPACFTVEHASLPSGVYVCDVFVAS